mgnify:CR=1 FL=1
MTDHIRFVNRFRHYYVSYFQDLCEKYDLTQLEVDILLFLYNNPECNTTRDIVELRGLAKSNVSTSIEALRRGGYLETSVDPTNRRKRRLHLYSETKGLVAELAQRQESCLRTLSKGFTWEETLQLQRLIQRMEENIRDVD